MIQMCSELNLVVFEKKNYENGAFLREIEGFKVECRFTPQRH